MITLSLLLLAASLNLASCGPIRRQDAARHFRFARSYNQSSSIGIATSSSSTVSDQPSAANLASQPLTLPLTSGTSVSTTSTVTSSSLSNPSGQVGQVPAFANDPGASTIANDASATLYSRSFTLGTDISTMSPMSSVQQGARPSYTTSNTVTINSSGDSRSLSTITTRDTSPVSLSFQTVISQTLNTLTSSISSVAPTTGVVIPESPPMIMASPGSLTGFVTSTVPATITIDSSSTTAQSPQAVTSTRTLGSSSAAAGSSITSYTYSAVATTILVSSSTVPSLTPNATVPSSQNSNLVMALAYNAIFDTLTADSDCSVADSSSAVACISGNFAHCGFDGKYTLASCPRGQRCFALPLPGNESGVSVQCDSSEDGASKLGLAASEATSVVSTSPISSTATLTPLIYPTSSTAIVPSASTGAPFTMASFATLVSSTRSAVTIPQISVAAQSTVIGITPLAFGASPTISAPQVVTSTPNSIASSSTRIASLSGTLQTTTASDVPSSLSTVLVQKSYATSTSVLPQATSVIAPTKISSFDLQPLPTSTGDPLLSMATSMPSSSKAPLSQFEAPTAPSPLPPGFPSASVTVVLITTPNPSLTQAPAYQTSIASTTALLASTPVVPTPAFTIIPVKNNATPTITKTVTETVTVSATVTLRG